jgi:hypothetical protein
MRPPRNLLILIVIALHPIWLAAPEPYKDVAFVVELLVMALFMTLLTPRIPPEPAARPKSFAMDHDGFAITLPKAYLLGPLVVSAFRGALWSGVGHAVILATGSSFEPTAKQLVLTAFPILVAIIGTIAAQSAAAIPIALGAWFLRKEQTLTLRGHRLRYGDQGMALSGNGTQVLQDDALTLTEPDGQQLTVRGNPATLSWLAESLAQIQPNGSPEDIPEALSQLMSRSTPIPSNT